MKIGSQQSEGFTLIEILIGTFILALICLGVAGVFKQFSMSEAFVTGTLNNARDGNTVVNQVAEELKYASKFTSISPGKSGLKFKYYKETLERSIFLKDNCVYLNNGGGDVLIGRNVSNLQFEYTDTEQRVVSIKATLHDSRLKGDYQLNTTVKLMNPEEEEQAELADSSNQIQP